MKVLIIGSTGIIGKAIVRAAISQGCDVVGVGLEHYSVPEEFDGRYRHLQLDRNNRDALRNAMREFAEPWDLFVDVVCYTSVQAQSMIDSLRIAPRHTFVISSALLYDREESLPLTARSRIAPLSEIGGYGKGKIEMEAIWLRQCDAGWPVTILRLPHVLGPGCYLGSQPIHNRDPQLLGRIAAGLPLYLVDGGRIVMQAVSSGDVARIVFYGFGRAVTFGNIYNCVCPEIFTGRQYYEEIAFCMGTEVHVEAVPAEVVWASGWGWNITAVPRVFDNADLSRDFSTSSMDSYRQSLKECVCGLLREGPALPLCDDEYSGLDRFLKSGRRELIDFLAAQVVSRKRQGVDARMNLLPLPVYY